jgi:hypothetical protein
MSCGKLAMDDRESLPNPDEYFRIMTSWRGIWFTAAVVKVGHGALDHGWRLWPFW